MREVIPDFLWTGDALQARDVRGVIDKGINVVIDLAIEEPPIQQPRDMIYCRFPLIGGDGNSPELLRSAIETTATFITAKRPTLVACSGGMSRSPAIVSAALAKAETLDLEAAVKRVAATGPCDFSPRLLAAVAKVCE